MKYIYPNILNFGSPNNDRGSLGHATYNWIAGKLIAKEMNLQFIHQPFEGDSTRFNEIMNLGEGHMTMDDININDLFVQELPHIDLNHRNSNTGLGYEKCIERLRTFFSDYHSDNTLYKLIQSGQFPGQLIRKSKCLCHEIGTRYWKANPYNHDKKYYEVAIHMRRGDIKQGANPDRWKGNEYYDKIISYIRKNINEEPMRITVYSEGELRDFNDVSADRFVLNGSDIDAFRAMAQADILVTGQSSFSTILAYINPNLIYYTPCLSFTLFDDFGEDRFVNIESVLDEN